jgi:2-iminobutanoate/2-iminopropanoate deaminase
MPNERSISSLEHGPVFSWHRSHDGWIYTSGHAAVDVDHLGLDPGDFVHEARLTLENLQRTLEKAGARLENVVKVTAYLTDLGNFPVFNQVYGQFFAGPNPPARTCVEVRRLPYNFKIEIEAVAHTSKRA